MFTNNVDGAECGGWKGGSEIIASAIESWVFEGKADALIIFFSNGTRCLLSPKIHQKTDETFTVTVKVRKS